MFPEGAETLAEVARARRQLEGHRLAGHGLGEAAVELLQPGMAVTRRTTPGGAGPEPVAVQIGNFERRLGIDRARLSSLRIEPAPAGESLSAG